MKGFSIFGLILLLSLGFSCSKSGSDDDTGFLVNPTISNPYTTTESDFSITFGGATYNSGNSRRYAVVYHNGSQVGVACSAYSNTPGNMGKELLKLIFYINLSGSQPLPNTDGATVNYSSTSGVIIAKFNASGGNPSLTPSGNALQMETNTAANISFSVHRTNSTTYDVTINALDPTNTPASHSFSNPVSAFKVTRY